MKKTFTERNWPWLVGLISIPVAALVLAMLTWLLNGLLLFPIAAWLEIYPLYSLVVYLLKRNQKRKGTREINHQEVPRN